MKKFVLYFSFLVSLCSGAQSLIHLDYRPSGTIIVFPFQYSKIYTDTSAIVYVYNQLQDPEYKKYFARIKNSLPALCRKTANDTIILEDMVPFEDTIAGLYPKYWYVDLTIFKLIHSAKIRITDREGNNVENLRSKHPRQKSTDSRTTIYINAATKEELFRETETNRPLNLVNEKKQAESR